MWDFPIPIPIPVPIPGVPDQTAPLTLPLTGVGYQGMFFGLLSAFALMLGAGLWMTQGARRRKAE